MNCCHCRPPLETPGYDFTGWAGPDRKDERKALRDRFAMAALVGLLNHEKYVDDESWATAETAYYLADAMLAERDKSK